MDKKIDELAAALRSGKCKVKFRKVSGEVTERVFTLNDRVLAESGWKPKETDKPRKPNPDVLVVFELPANTWKSFRKESVIEWSEIKEEPKHGDQLKG